MWTKLDDQFLRNRKLRAAGRDAALLYLAGLLHCSEHLTDGVILDPELPLVAAAAWVREEEVPLLVERLLHPLPGTPASCLWERIEGGFRVHDFLAYNPSRQDALAHREQLSAARSKAGRKGGLASARQRRSKREAASEQQEDHVSREQGNRDPIPSPSAVPDPVSEPEPVTVPSEGADGPDESHQVLELLGVRANTTALTLARKAIGDHPDTDPLAVALEYLRWQQNEQEQGTPPHRDRLKGWNNALHRAAARGYYRRALRVSGAEEQPPELVPTGLPPWDQARVELLLAVGSGNFREWFEPLRPLSLEGAVLTLEAPDERHADWLSTRLHHRIVEALARCGHPDIQPRYVSP